MSSPYVESNQDILTHIFTQLRWYILEEKMIMSTANPTVSMIESVHNGPESNQHYSLMMSRLEEPIRFDGPNRKINKQNYYVVKHRLTKYNEDIVDNEIRAGYMYVLVKKSSNVSVSFFYAHDTQDLSNTPASKKWVKWSHSNEGWIIYDGDNGHIRGNLSGGLFDE